MKGALTVDILKKAAVFLLAAFIAAVPVKASAHDFAPSAETISSGTEYEFWLEGEGDTYYYRLKASDRGILTVKLIAYAEHSSIIVTNADGAVVYPYKGKVSAGKLGFDREGGTNLVWNEKLGYFSGNAKYEVAKGTYYIRVTKDCTSRGADFVLKAEFPSRVSKKPSFDYDAAVEVTDDEPSPQSSKSQVYAISVELKNGTTLDLSNLLGISENTYKEKYVRWYTSDSRIVSVDRRGSVTAKSEGTALITVYVGSKQTDVFINVIE